jgi:lipopolysaccharide export system permease protein
MSAAMMQARIVEIEQNIAMLERHMHRTAAHPILSRLATEHPELERVGPDDAGPDRIPEPGGVAPRGERTSGPRSVAVQVLHVLENETNIVESNRNQISRYGVEIHKKFSIPFSCIIFVLLGAPLAIRSGKKGMTMAIGFSILFFLIYYMFLISGEKLADRRLVSPWLAMWMPNIILLAAALFLLHATVREAQTINWSRFNPLKRRRGGEPTEN